MAGTKTITSANAQLTIFAPDVFDIPQVIQGFAVDEAWESERVKPVEARMGVDRKLSGGYTPYAVPFGFTLQPDSDSIDVMDAILQGMATAGEAFEIQFVLTAPSINKQYDLTNGFLTDGQVLPPGKKVLEPQHYGFMFESYTANPI